MPGEGKGAIVSLLLFLAFASSAHADDLTVSVGVSQSKQLSSLFDHILPIFKAASNLNLHVFGLDSGDAAAIEKRSGANALLLDQADLKDKISADGYG
jgi:tungstate transport system substrate-binding protein